MPDFLLALAVQVPLVAGFFVALQRGWFYTGSAVERERIEHAKELAYREVLLAAAVAERKEAENRLDSFKDTLKESSDVLAQSVAFNERLVAEISRAR